MSVIPLVDTHCHLLARLDDGPKSDEQAVQMCRLAYDDGVRFVCATAHQNEFWPDVTPECIQSATGRLIDQLHEAGIPLTVAPCAEVMLHPEMDEGMANGWFMTVANQGKYLLIEMPHRVFVDALPIVEMLVGRGIRPILAHPERTPELIEETAEIIRLINAGCLMQVSSRSVTGSSNPKFSRRLRNWFKQGLVHLIGSDGHSTRHRKPLLAKAYQTIVRWIGLSAADRICSSNGMAVIQGVDLHVPEPRIPAKRWFSWA